MRTVGTELEGPANPNNELKLIKFCNKVQTGVLILGLGVSTLSHYINIEDLAELYCTLPKKWLYPLVLTEQT